MANTGIIRPFDHQIGMLCRLVDTAMLVAVLWVCFRVYLPNTVWPDKYSLLAISAVVLFYLFSHTNQLYQSYRTAGLAAEIRPLAATWAATITSLLLLGYAFKITQEMSRVVLGFWMILTPLVMLAQRAAVRAVLQSQRAQGRNTRSVLIVGDNTSGQTLAQTIQNSPALGLKLLGFISTDAAGTVNEGATAVPGFVGDLGELYRRARQNEVDIVYLALDFSKHYLIDDILKELGDSTVSISLVPDLHVAELMQGTWLTVGVTPTVSIIHDPGVGVNGWLKRIEDVVVSVLVLVIMAVPMAIIALGVKRSSAGPVLYKQQRYGINGRRIDVWKFRSMSVTESNTEFVQATKDDARVTPFGQFLRKTSLDELPQFFNVLAGDMSVVGPRPHAAAHNEQFRKKVNGYMLRHKVKPGITGLAQISGCRGETNTEKKMERRVKYDVEYINNWSILLDFAIIFRTPWNILFSKDAY